MRWYHFDAGQPLLAAATAGSVCKWLIPFPETVWLSLLGLTLISVVALAACIIAAPEIRILALGSRPDRVERSRAAKGWQPKSSFDDPVESP
jgi:hypothetical protein